jgi:hypothetical protein
MFQLESLEPRLLLAADLTGVLQSALLVDPAVPTNSASAVVQVQNIGNRNVTQSQVGVYASLDSVLDSSDMLLGTVNTGQVNAGQSKNVTVNLTVPNTLAPMSYHLLAKVDNANAIAENSETNNVAVGGTLNVAWQFGSVPGRSGNTTLTLKDVDGTTVTVSLTGPGLGEVIKDGTSRDLKITGTDPTSAVTITTNSGGNGRVTLNDIHVFGALASFTAGTTDLTGTLAIDGPVNIPGLTPGTITLGSIQGGTVAVPSVEALTILGSTTNAKLYIGTTFGQDGQPDGSGANADTYGAGKIGLFTVAGAMSGTSVRVGINPVDGLYGNGNDQLIGGTSSSIGGIIIGGALSADTRFYAGAFPTQYLHGLTLKPTAGDFHFISNFSGPALNAALQQDTGSSATDTLTNNPAITGSVTDPQGIATFVAGFGATPTVNVLSDRQPNGSFTFTQARLEQINGAPLVDGPYSLKLAATDSAGNSTQISVSFTLDTQVPVLTFDLAAASDTAPVGDQQTTNAIVTLVGQTEANALVELVGLGVQTTADASGNFSFSTVALALGANSFTVRVTDAAGNQRSETRTITRVAAGNSAPVLNLIGNQTIAEETQLTFTTTATDADLPAQALTFSLVNAPAGATINATTGVFAWTPTEAQGLGVYLFDVVVSDGALTDSETITVTVNEVNLAPVLTAIGNQTVDELQTLTFTASAIDSDLPVNNLTFSLVNAQAGAAIHATTGVFTWTPVEGQGPNSTFDVVVSDGTATDSETIQVTVNEVNVAPVLSTIGSHTVNEGATLTFTASASDADLPTNSLAFSLTNAPAGASIDPTTGVFAWTPTEGQGPGIFVFDVVVTDNGTPALTGSETIAVTVKEVNLAPGLNTIGNQSVNEGQLLTFTATVADADLPANTLTYSLAGTVPSGAAIDATTGVFTWTPSEAQGLGSFAFDVVVSDGLLSDSETITVTVTEVNQTPTLNPIGNQMVNEGTELRFTLLASDPDLPGQALVFGASGLPTGATFNTATREFVWTPSDTQGPNTYDVTFSVTDGVVTTSETITITVNEVNQAPVLTLVGNQTVSEGQLLSFTATATDTDVPVQQLTFSLENGATGQVPGGASITAGGLFTWTPTEVQGPGSYIFDVVVSDGTLSDSETITVTVNEANLAPVLNLIGNQIVNEGQPLTFTAGATDADLPAQPLTFSLANGATGQVPVGASIDPASGVFTWTPTEAQGPGTFTFDVVVTDNGTLALSDSETITVTVNEGNQTPTFTSSPTVSVQENQTQVMTVTASDADVPGQPLIYSLAGGADAAAFAVTSGGALSFQTAPNFESPTDANLDNVYEVTVQVSDGVGGIATQVLQVTVTNVVENIPAISINDITQTEGTSLTGFTAYNFTVTLSIPTTDIVTVQVATADFTATAGSGDYQAVPLTTVTFGPGETTKTVTVQVRQDDLQEGTEQLRVLLSNATNATLVDSQGLGTITNDDAVNQPPVLNTIGNQSVNEGATLRFTATATDTNVGQTLTFSLANGATGQVPAGASITAGGAFTWTPTEAQGPGSYAFDVVVSDGVLSDSETITVTVGEVNQAPILNPIGNQSVNEGQQLVVNVTVTDADGPSLTTFSFSLENGVSGLVPAGAVIAGGTGQLTWTPAEAQGPGSYTFDVVVTDNGTPALSARETITVTVGEVNQAPTLQAIPNQTATAGQLLTFTAVGTDPDIPANSLTYSLDLSLLPPGFGTLNTPIINPTTGVFTWTSAEGQVGTHQITVRVTDNDAPSLFAEQAFLVTVATGNQAPVLASIGNQAVNAGQQLTFTATATDADVPAQQLTFSLQGTVPLGASINPTTGAFSWTPNAAQVGAQTVTVRVTDNGINPLFAEQSVTVTVRADADLDGVPDTEEAGGSNGGDANQDGMADSQQANVASLQNAIDSQYVTLVSTVGTQLVNVQAGPVAPGAPVNVEFPFGQFGFEVHGVTPGGSAQVTMLLPNGSLVNSFYKYGPEPGLSPLDQAHWYDFNLNGGTGATISGDTVTLSFIDGARGDADLAANGVIVDPGVPGRSTNQPPVLAPIGPQSVNEGSELRITVTATDPNQSDNLTINFFPRSGNLFGAQFVPSGVNTYDFIWTPGEVEGPGQHQVQFDVFDGVNPPVSEIVTITVNEVNIDPLIFVNGPTTVAEEGFLHFEVRGFDPDFPQNALTLSVTGLPAGATFTPINSSRYSFDWAPTEVQGPGVYDVIFTVSDGQGGVTAQPVSLTVNEVNRPPVIVSIDGPPEVDEQTEWQAVVTASDLDLPANTLSASLDSTAVALGVTITPGTTTNTWNLRWTPNEAQGLWPLPGIYSFDVQVSDNVPGSPSVSQTVTVTVNEVNQPPILNEIGNKTVVEGTRQLELALIGNKTVAEATPGLPPLSFTVTATNQGPGVPPLTFTATATDDDLPANNRTFSLAAPSVVPSGAIPGVPATATINGTTGEFVWNLDESHVGNTYVFDVVVKDGTGTTNENDFETITVTVTGNGQPNNLTFSLENEPVGATINSTTGLFEWAPTELQGGNSYTFDVVVTSGTETDRETITVTVNEVNRPPVLSAIAPQTMDEETELIVPLTATDPDVPANSLTFELVGAPDWATIVAGQLRLAPDEAAGLWPPPGVYNFNVVVRDGAPGTPDPVSVQTVTVTVREVNQAPVIVSIDAQPEVDEESLTPWQAVVTASDPDLPANQLRVDLDAVAIALGAQLIQRGNINVWDLNWTPDEAQGPGDYTFTVTVSDQVPGDTKTASQSVTVHVNEVNRPPVLESIRNRIWNEGELLTIVLSASDPDRPVLNTLTYEATGLGGGPLPAGANFDPTTRTFSWRPTEVQGGTGETFTAVFTVRDDGTPSKSASETVSITVNEVNEQPVLAFIPDQTMNEQTVLRVPVFVTDADEPTNQLDVELVATPTWARIEAETDPLTPHAWELVLSPGEEQGQDDYALEVRVRDNAIGAVNGEFMDSQFVSVHVNEVNREPVVTIVPLQPTADEGMPWQAVVTASDPDIPANQLSADLDPASIALGAELVRRGTTNVWDLFWTPTAGNGSGGGTSAASFQGLGDLPGGTFESRLDMVSGNGAVVVGQSVSTNGFEPYRWTPAGGAGSYTLKVLVTDTGTPALFGEQTVTVTVSGGMEVLSSVTGLPLGEVRALSFDGSVLVGKSAEGTAFRWSQIDGFKIIAGEGSNFTSANAVSSDGSIVVGGGYIFPFPPASAFRWTAATGAIRLDNLSGYDNSEAFAVSNDGNVIVGVSYTGLGIPYQGLDDQQAQAVRWVADGLGGFTVEALGDLPGGNVMSSALAVSADGTVIVGVSESDFGRDSFRWTATEGMQRLGDGALEGAFGVSADGSVIVGGNQGNPFVWDANNGVRSLNQVFFELGVPGTDSWFILSAEGISADGRTIVGEAFNPQGDIEVWRAVLPENAFSPEFITVPVGNYQVQAGQEISFNFSANDFDSPAQLVNFRLMGNVPTGVVWLNSFFSWTPTNDDVGDHVFTVRAYDNGVPSRFTDVQFSITVTA